MPEGQPASWPLGRAARDEIHLWRISLDQPTAAVEALVAALPADERSRAGGFRSAPLRRRFVVARAARREILARYVDLAPARLRFALGPHGKPGLAPEQGREDLRFSLAHAADLALLAVGRERELGVDLEQVRERGQPLLIAERFFSPLELHQLRSLPPEQRLLGFLVAWTRKEAYLKARGDGLTVDLAAFDVSLVPGEPARLLASRLEPADVQRWSLRSLDPAPGYVGALAVEGTGWLLRCRDWPDSPAGAGALDHPPA